MNLEVKGSNPFTHPILVKPKKTLEPLEFWTLVIETFSNKFLEKQSNTELIKLSYYHQYWLKICKQVSIRELKPKFSYTKHISNSFTVKSIFDKSDSLQTNFKFKNRVHSLDYASTVDYNTKEGGLVEYSMNPKSLQTFITFLIVNLDTTQNGFIPNSTSQSFYISHAKGGSKVINISKLFKKWLDFYNLVFNVFYFNTRVLTFTPPSHMKEAISLNWDEFTQVEKLWRYSKPFLLNKPNTINDDGDFVFRKLKLKGWSLGIVSDITYHSKSLIYLRRAGFYTLASLPSMYDDSLLDFFLPSTSDTLLTQSYFLRTVIKIKNNAIMLYSSFLFSERLTLL